MDIPPAPSFDTLDLHSALMQGIHDMGFLHMTPIQAKAIPIVLAGKDLIGTAQTGTGKTAAFLVPILQHLIQIQSQQRKIRTLVLSPTRELALQIDEQMMALGYYTSLKHASVCGGMEMIPQERALKANADVVIATPGRLIDHLSRGYVHFDGLKFLVLDEADRMLDMGFLPDIKRILARLPVKRQTLLFSATMPPEITRLAKEILRDPERIEIGSRSTPAVGITQAAYPVPEHLKKPLVLELLRGQKMTSVLIFTRTKHGADQVARGVERGGFTVERMHSNRTQQQRIAALEGFRNGKYQILVATDIAARGIDVDNISHVINYDVPHDPHDYIHRIGRTGRAEATGDAFTLVTPQEEPLLRDIEKHVGKPLPRVTLPDFNYKTPPAPWTGGGERGGRPGGGGRRFGGGGGGRPGGRPGGGGGRRGR